MDRDDEKIEWDDQGTVHMPSARGTAVQSVRFAAEDIRAIRVAARRSGISTSEFIREAALAKIARPSFSADPQVSWGGGIAGSFVDFDCNGTASTAPRVRQLAPA